jgi:4-hydroxybenzoate polyprenyltransferase
MKFLLQFLKLIRYKNIGMIALTQVFTYFFLNSDIHYFHLLEIPFVKLLMTTAMVAAAGYIINDYMDVKLDLINKPNQVIVGKSISRRWAMFLHFLLSAGAFFIGLSISKKIGFAVLCCSFLLWIYSQFLKKTYLTGNILVSLLSASSLLILFLFKTNELQSYGIYSYAGFAFIITLIREIIKDMEDMKGDHAYQSKTLPIVSGIRKTKTILYLLIGSLFTLCIFNMVLFGSMAYSSKIASIGYQVYLFCTVLIPLFFCYKGIKIADTKKAFGKLSFQFKLIMLFGILSMVFWRF